MKVKTLFLLIGLVLAAGNVKAQFEEFEQVDTSVKDSDTSGDAGSQRLIDRLTFGGMCGFGFGSFVYVSVEPRVGYKINDYFTAGVSGMYEYFKYSDYDYSTSVYGGGIYAEAFPFKGLTLHLEAQALNFENYGYYNSYRMWDYPILAGFGWRSQSEGRFGITYLLLFNLNNTESLSNNVYTNPIVKICFNF